MHNLNFASVAKMHNLRFASVAKMTFFKEKLQIGLNGGNGHIIVNMQSFYKVQDGLRKV